MNNACIIQARTTSTRFPNKIFSPFKGLKVLTYLLANLRKSKKIDKIILAVPESQKKDIESKIGDTFFYDFIFGGSEYSLIDRYYKAYRTLCPDIDYIIRITSDCPCVSPKVIDRMISLYEKIGEGYLCNTNFKNCYPSGLDVEIFDVKSLRKIFYHKDIEKEHLALAFGKFGKELGIPIYGFTTPGVKNNIELSIDVLCDLEFIESIYKNEDQLLEHINANLSKKAVLSKIKYNHSVHDTGKKRRL